MSYTQTYPQVWITLGWDVAVPYPSLPTRWTTRARWPTPADPAGGEFTGRTTRSGGTS
jgi:hypothetical protein